MRVLLLGGTGEARALAARLHPYVDIVSSLAGRVPNPALPVGPVRIGGFGGAAGLRNWLTDNGITAVIDATHPFAATITVNGVSACRELGVPHLLLHRQPWEIDGALQVKSDIAAAETVAAKGYPRVFLTNGRSGLRPFAAARAWFLIRVVTPPDPAVLPAEHQLLLSRGPYRYEGERALLAEHGIEALVTKNSGGEMTRAKLDAAHSLGIDVVMIEPPAPPSGLTIVHSVSDAASWALDQPG